MAARSDTSSTPEEFRVAVSQTESARARPEIHIDVLPPPARLAPFAHALSGDLAVDNQELASGRFVLLHDPAGHPAWNGTFRCVTFAHAEIEGELATDPMITAVGWSWLIDALAEREAQFAEENGSVTVVRSDAFGHMAEDGPSAQIEVRASWTPVGDLTTHTEAWFELLALLAGLPPLHPDVVPLHGRRGGR